jgi:uncharacterized repeat protein (TIGR03803 family)
MRINKPSNSMMLVLTVLAATLFVNLQPASAQEESVLLSFKKRTDLGNYPRAGLIFDNAGNLYGTASGGGTGGGGTVFELSPRAGGGWNEAVLYSFSPKPKYTLNQVSGVVLDKAGNLYGTTFLGGSKNLGRVFELVRQADGSFTEKVLHNFQNNGTDGYGPLGGVILDSSGNLYGTTVYGGNGPCAFQACGTVFELTPQPNGLWAEKIVYNFTNGADGANPYFGLIFDTAGNLYGTTEYGGVNAGGTAFELTPAAGGTWTESVIHSFGNGNDTGYPEGLTFYKGNIYGATANGGSHDGNVFELSPATGGGWNENILASFFYGNDGNNPDMPNGNVVFDASGNIYGLSQGGSGLNGTVFELTPAQDGTWDTTILYTFNNLGTTGADPFGGLILDSLGNLYGVTQYGGAYDAGTVFEVKP